MNEYVVNYNIGHAIERNAHACKKFVVKIAKTNNNQACANSAKKEEEKVIPFKKMLVFLVVRLM